MVWSFLSPSNSQALTQGSFALRRQTVCHQWALYRCRRWAQGALCGRALLPSRRGDVAAAGRLQLGVVSVRVSPSLGCGPSSIQRDGPGALGLRLQVCGQHPWGQTDGCSGSKAETWRGPCSGDPRWFRVSLGCCVPPSQQCPVVSFLPFQLGWFVLSECSFTSPYVINPETSLLVLSLTFRKFKARRTGFLNLRVLLSSCGRRSHWCGVPAALGTSLSTSVCLPVTLPSPSLKDVLAACRVLCWPCCLLAHFKHTLSLHSRVGHSVVRLSARPTSGVHFLWWAHLFGGSVRPPITVRVRWPPKTSTFHLAT